MPRWHLLNRLFRIHPCDELRCILVVEELEGREVPAPLVTSLFPIMPSVDEGASYTLSGNNTFFVTETNEFAETSYTAVLSSPLGNFTVDVAGAEEFGVAVTNNGTSALTLAGSLEGINSVLGSVGVDFNPTAFYSGDAAVTLTVTDTDSGESGAGNVTFRVLPDIQSPGVFVDFFGELRAPASGFVFTPGFVGINPWPDLDGSEGVTLFFSVDAENPEGFALTAGGVPLSPVEPGLWALTDTNPVALQALVDTLALVPPSGFTGRVTLSIFGNIRDQATYSVGPPESVTQFYLSQNAFLRFFQGASISAPAVFALEGGSIDLGGRFAVSDPDLLEGDTHTLTLSVPSGTFVFNEAAVPEGISIAREVAADGSTTILLLGELSLIQQFLATPGSMTYAPVSVFFSGVIPLTLTLTSSPGVPFFEYPDAGESPGEGQFGPLEVRGDVPAPVTAVAPLTFVPVASRVFPSASDAVTDQDTAVPVFITLSALADTDGSESVLVIVEGMPVGAAFNRGTDLGGGQWAFTPEELDGLIFTPPPGAAGAFTFVVKAMVTDSAPGVGSDSATESTTFTVTVNPAPVVPPPVVPPPVVQLPPPATTLLAPAPLLEVITTPVALGDATDTSGDDTPEVQTNTNVVFSGASLSATTEQSGLGAVENRADLAPPSPASLFGQPESPRPAYAGGEKHPLPPVLPLDQTLPVAGFSESGGDSIALVDRIYRDANAAPPMTGVSLAPAPREVPQDVAEQGAAVAVANSADPGAGAGLAPLDGANANETQWRTWVAGTVIAGALAAWAWMSRRPESLLAWAARQFFRTLPRRTPERVA